MTWFRMPLFLWSIYATSLILVLATPVLAITLVLVAIERTFNGVGIFNPELGGDPLLFQHLFWFYSHPAVYIMILPGMGVMSELITCFSRKRIFGYEFVAFSSVAIAGDRVSRLGASHVRRRRLDVWRDDLLVPQFSRRGAFGDQGLQLDGNALQGLDLLATPMLYAGGFIGLFTLGGLTGLMLATLGIDMHVHDTYFVIAHFHYIMVGGMVMAYLGGIHFWWPKITGRLYSERWGQDFGNRYLPRFQSHVLPAVRPGISGNAPPISLLSARVSGAQRALDGRRIDPRASGICCPFLSHLFAVSRRATPAPILGEPPASNGRPRPLRRSKTLTRCRRDRRSLRVSRPAIRRELPWTTGDSRKGPRPMTEVQTMPPNTFRLWPSNSRTSSSSRNPQRWACGRFSRPKFSFSAPCSSSYTICRMRWPEHFATGASI